MDFLIVSILLIVIIYFVTKRAKKVSSRTYGDNYDKYLIMLKEATQLKKTNNLDDAIQKIKDALAIYNQDGKGYFKLAYYLQLNKKFDEGWNVLNDYLNQLNSNDYFMYHMNCHTVHTEMTKQLKREKKWKDYLYHQAVAKYGLFIAFAMQGRIEELKSLFERLEEEDWFDLSPIKNEQIKNEWRKIISIFINSKKEELLETARYTKKHQLRILDKSGRTDPYLSKINKTLNAESIGMIYNDKISPLLVDVL